MSIRLTCGLLLFCVLFAPHTAFPEEITVLTIKEQAGVARKDEPIRMGIPLPKGVAKDVGELALVDAAGKPVPVQFKPVARWLEDKSLRWVHAIFQASVPAKGEVKVRLIKGQAAQTAGKMKVSDSKDGVIVENGVLKLAVRGIGLNLIDAAWYDPAGKFGPETQVIAHHDGGFVATIGGKPYRPDATSTVAVEEKGTEGAVIKISGRLANGDDAPFTYVCYLHVYQGSPEVRVDFAYTNAQGARPADHVTLQDLSLVLPTTIADGTAEVGGQNGCHVGKRVKVIARSSDLNELMVDGKQAGTAKGKSTKPLTVGWVGLRSGKKSLAIGVRWFWQMFPKAMEASAGTLRAGLYAREAGQPLDVYMGQGRTHYLTLMFHDSTPAYSSAPALLSFFAGRQMPLRAVCTPKYYCRTSQAFGPIADADPSLYPADLAAAAKKYDANLKRSIQLIARKIDGHTYGGATVDSYGYNAWGDVFHWASNRGQTPWDIQWASNYYDYPWAALLQFARTGDLDYLDICDRHGLHLADVFMCKWHPKKHLRGACRYSPPDNHVGMNRKPYVSVEFNHHKAQSILTRYLLLGDLRARDDFMLALNNATLNREGSWRQCRGAGAKLWTLTEGYRLTGGDAAVMKMMKSTVAAGVGRIKSGGSSFGHSKGQFMYGHATEGLLRYWWLTQDADAIRVMKVMNDWLISADKLKQATGNSAMSMAFLWRQTGDAKYRDAAVKLLGWTGATNRPKSFGQSFRSTAYAWYYLSEPAAKKAGE